MVADASTLSQPVTGTAAGVPFLALPPANGEVPAPLVLGLHAFEPPRAEAALAGTAPMASLPAWRVYLGLPLFGARLPEGGVAEINRRGERDYLVELFGPVVEEAAAELHRVAAELRATFPVTDDPVGLVGVGAGASAVLLSLAEGHLPVSAAAVINPVVDPALVIAARERHTGAHYEWTEQAWLARGWLDFGSRAEEISRNGVPLLVVSGGQDEVVPPEHGRSLHDALAAHVPEHALRHIVVPDLAHSIGPEPGLRPGPLTPAGVLTDRALTEWLHLHLTSSSQVRGAEEA
ncbi:MULTISPECIES: alpha/beta hydrolase family protein [Nocardiopsis]|uniref:Peptidase n=1 Tax=Nocardiopsis sinuspersici TaxID=501010 RepID=A0A1V3C6A5_9ACTN|nr:MULTISPECIES: prolyl oligopeptidase family serine peptidase [Nocardiopsis]NYH52546.1 pimeloyl-ACP methyl ester carboxylesterase [Nocardiopsis sinuspersici]OOC56019.1 peptidase [Nocardiopsis sinuspersici]